MSVVIETRKATGVLGNSLSQSNFGELNQKIEALQRKAISTLLGPPTITKESSKLTSFSLVVAFRKLIVFEAIRFMAVLNNFWKRILNICFILIPT